MRRLPLLSILAAGVALSLLLGARVASAQQVDTLDYANSALGLPVVASAPPGAIHGEVHVAWRRTPALFHAWKGPGPWQTEAVADSVLGIDIAVRENGQPLLAWADSRGNVICAERGLAGWSRDTIATFPGTTLNLSLALHGEPAIAFFVQPASGPVSLRYARRSGSTWTVTELGEGSRIPQLSLAFGPGGKPGIAFNRSGTGLVVLEGAFPDGPFTEAVVDSEAAHVMALAWDIVRDRAMLHYVAAPEGSAESRFAWRNTAGEWVRRTTGTLLTWFYGSVSLALDPLGAPGALWKETSWIGPNSGAGGEVDACGTIWTGSLQLSQQTAGVPSGPFTTSSIPTVFAYHPRTSLRAVHSNRPGVFGVTWREPDDGCAPNGVFYTEVGPPTTAVPIESPPLAARLDLSPNPVTSAATVRLRWSQPRAADVRLVAHDVAGRVVMSFALGRLPAGEHEHAWNPAALAPGLYWASLRLDGERVARTTLVSR